MITLKELLQTTSKLHYRIYQPNRDCLIFESYFKIHSPYDFDDISNYNKNYFDDNDYCEPSVMDEETSKFLEKFGDYIVTDIEVSSCSPVRFFKTEIGEFKIETSQLAPNKPKDCLNVFIIPNE